MIRASEIFVRSSSLTTGLRSLFSALPLCAVDSSDSSLVKYLGRFIQWTILTCWNDAYKVYKPHTTHYSLGFTIFISH